MKPRNIKLGTGLIFVFLLGTLFFLQACKQQMPEINSIKNFPLKTGNSWQYEILSTANKCLGYMDWQVAEYITNDPKFKQSRQLNMVYKNERKVTIDVQSIIIKRDRGNLKYYTPQQTSINFQLFLSPYPLQAGQTWELNNQLERFQVETMEKVHTPAGTFWCAKIKYHSDLAFVPGTALYYLSEAGLIKFITNDKIFILNNYKLKS